MRIRANRTTKATGELNVAVLDNGWVVNTRFSRRSDLSDGKEDVDLDGLQEYTHTSKVFSFDQGKAFRDYLEETTKTFMNLGLGK